MFTGIIEEVGAVADIKRTGNVVRLKVLCEKVTSDLNEGDSVCVSGVCLTVVEASERFFEVDLAPETVQKTIFCDVQRGMPVNLERALRAGDRLGGHIVTGHVDAVGNVRFVQRNGETVVMEFEVSPHLMSYIAEKGSIAVDGVSLTVASLSFKSFGVAVIPFTLKNTTLGLKTSGSKINIEVDIFARYVERFLRKSKTSDRYLRGFLKGGK